MGTLWSRFGGHHGLTRAMLNGRFEQHWTFYRRGGVAWGAMDVDLSARAGVVTGEVAVSFAADGGALVAGDAVNTAARIQAAAHPGWVLVDEATRRLTASAIAFSDAGMHTLKGKSEPAQLWRAIRVVSGLAGSQRPAGLEAPLCGRDAELRSTQRVISRLH